MKEVRELTREELNRLVEEGPEWSTKELMDYCEVNKVEPYDFFKTYAVKQRGVIKNGRPLYYGALVNNGNKYILYTFINKDLSESEHIGVYKAAKRTAHEWARDTEIWSYIDKDMELQKKWTLKMGFQKVKEDDKFMISKLGGNNV